MKRSSFKIMVLGNNGRNKWLKVNGYVLGHLGLDKRMDWIVTHLPTGCEVFRSDHFTIARRFLKKAQAIDWEFRNRKSPKVNLTEVKVKEIVANL